MTQFRIYRHPIVLLRPHISPPYAWVGHIPFAYLMVDLLRPHLFVELGTDSGNSYLAFCQAVDYLGADTQCVAIDSWEGDEHARYYGEEVYSTLKAYHEPRYAAFSNLMRQRFEQAVNEFEDGTIDLLHIDGLHTYEAVKLDFETWLPKLSGRAVVLFHDSAVRDRDFGVSTFVDELRDRYRIFEFTHSNGLAVVAVGADIPTEFHAFMDATDSDGDALREYFRAVAGTFFDVEHQLPVGVETPRWQLDSRLYYRNHGEGNTEERSLVAKSTPELFDGRTLVVFHLPEGLRPDVLRFDPADAPGIFGIASIRFQSKSTSSEIRLEGVSTRMVRLNADYLPEQHPYFLRFASLHSDPGVEFFIDDLWSEFDASDGIDVVFDVNFEAVLDDPVLRQIALAEDATLARFRAFDRRETSFAEAAVEIAALSSSLKAMDDRIAKATSLLDAGSAALENHKQVVSQALIDLDDRFDATSRAVDDHKQVINQALSEIQSGLNATSVLDEQIGARAEVTDRQVQSIAESMQKQIDDIAQQTSLLELQHLLLEQQSRAIESLRAATFGARVRRLLGMSPRGSFQPIGKS